MPLRFILVLDLKTLSLQIVLLCPVNSYWIPFYCSGFNFYHFWIFDKSSHLGGSHADTGTPRKMKPWMIWYHQEQKLMQRLLEDPKDHLVTASLVSENWAVLRQLQNFQRSYTSMFSTKLWSNLHNSISQKNKIQKTIFTCFPVMKLKIKQN